jgi:preprotein translocase subunit YajC
MKRLHIRILGALVAGLSAAQDVFAQGAPAAAPAAAQPPTIMSALWDMLPMLAICYLIFYVMVIRPQESKTKKHKAFLEALKRGDSVVTSSGIVGKVAGIEKDHLLLEVAQNVKLKVLLSHVSRLETEPTAA